MKLIKKLTLKAAFGVGIAILASSAQAGLIDDGTWAGWTTFADEDLTGNFSRVYPGWGGQDFDAEFLLYKVDGDQLHVGLQTGFDVEDGHLEYGGKNYWAGDLFLSFNNDDTTFEYAVDFGFDNCGYSYRSNKAGCDALTPDSVGLYQVATENNDIYFSGQSSPYQMATGSLIDNGLLATTSGSDSVDGQLSYYRTATLDLNKIGGFNGFDAHWTMSCGNDAIDGHASVSVPAPAGLALFALGLLFVGHRKQTA